MGESARIARRAGAGGAALGWILGLYALPFLHQLDHRSDHTHGPLPRESSPPQEHPHPHPHEAPSSRVPLDSEHGSGSVLHFATAALNAEAPRLPPLGTTLVLPPPPSPRAACSAPQLLLCVRGPPSLA